MTVISAEQSSKSIFQTASRWRQRLFNLCSGCTKGDIGRNVLAGTIPHIGCFVAPMIGGFAGGQIGNTVMNISMQWLIVSPALAIGITWAIGQLQNQSSSFGKLALSAVMALGVSGAANFLFTQRHHDLHQLLLDGMCEVETTPPIKLSEVNPGQFQLTHQAFFDNRFPR